MSFISMQLIEYFTWKNIDNKKINKIISYIAMILLLIHVPLLAIAYNKNKSVNYIIITIFLIFIVLTCFNINSNNISITKSKNGHLQWNFIVINIISLIYFATAFSILLYNKEYLLFTVIFITLLFSLYSYYKSNTWGSVWCWTVNILSFYLIVRVFYKDFCTLDGTIL